MSKRSFEAYIHSKGRRKRKKKKATAVLRAVESLLEGAGYMMGPPLEHKKERKDQR